MLISRKPFPTGSTIRYEVDYSYWLQPGRTLAAAGFSVTLLPDPITALVPTGVTISQISVTEDKLYFFLQDTGVNELFTLQVQVGDTLGEVVIDTIEFFIV